MMPRNVFLSHNQADKITNRVFSFDSPKAITRATRRRAATCFRAASTSLWCLPRRTSPQRGKVSRPLTVTSTILDT
jgi:hypothetical protein